MKAKAKPELVLGMPVSGLKKAKAIYIHASYFDFADRVLRKHAKRKPYHFVALQFPGVAISAFASELFLKCLLVLDGEKPPRCHNLLELYRRLRPETIELIEAEWTIAVKVTGPQIEAMEKRFKVKVPRDLKGTLRDCGDAFDEMRYLYEAPKVAFYIAPLPSVLRFVIERRTDWKMSLP